MLDDKIFVSYLGGSAGDMFAASCNGIDLADDSFKSIAVKDIPYSIKHKEYDIEKGLTTLDQAVAEISHKYISTHIFDNLPNRINITVKDPLILHRVVCRQMSIQRLRLELNTGFFSNNIRNLCLKEKYHNAGMLWFTFAEKLAQDRMTTRLQHKGLDFSKLFDDDFTNDLTNQGWFHNIELLKKNHSVWLLKQKQLTKEMAITAIENKLQKMDWTKTSGLVAYED